MANIKKRLPDNAAGDFFVDSTCIDCDTCRQLAPDIFGETGEFAFVKRQPSSEIERRSAFRAVLSCPTGSIGFLGTPSPAIAAEDFPLAIEQPVYYCGFNSRKSYGGNSYFVSRPDGNWLIDSPKFLPQLTSRIERLGGIANVFLTHRDDVADADRYARHFAARRFIHHDERQSQPDAEVFVHGDLPIGLADGIVAIPTPGHTKGHCCLLVDNRFLFTGDHLAYDRHEQRLTAFRDYCWHSWDRQIESMERLLDFDFEWILPGHGQRVQHAASEMRREVIDLIKRMEADQ